MGSTVDYIWPSGVLTSDGTVWPEGVPREESVAAFEQMLAIYGFEPCGQDGAEQIGFDKVALYAVNGVRPAHAARMVAGGSWTSKVGDFVDVSHAEATDVESRAYGRIVGFYRRRRDT